MSDRSTSPEVLVERMLMGDGHSRREFLRRLAGTGLALSSAGVLAACGGVEGSNAGGQVDKSAKGDHPKKPIGDWTFANWPLYIDKAVLKDFDRRFGGKVKYVEEINDNFEFFSKVRQQLQRGDAIGRDIVTLTDYMANRWVRSGWTEPLDPDNIPNVKKNLEDNLRKPPFDPEGSYAVPWQSGAIIIGYDPKLTGGRLTSFNDLLDPKLKGKVTFLSEPYDAAGSVLLAEGKDAGNASLNDMLGAIDTIEKAQQDGQIRRFTGNDYTNDLAKGDIAAAMGYSGDLVQLKADNPNLQYAYPEEGAMLFTDWMLLAQKTPNAYAAETMMNYVYEPEVAATIAAFVNYISPVKGVRDVLAKRDPSLAENPLIFPPDDVRAKLIPYPSLSPQEETQLRERMAEVTGA